MPVNTETDDTKLLTKQEVMDYLGISVEDARFSRRCEHLIEVADSYLTSAIGTNYPKDDTRSKELGLIIISDLYDNHDMNDKVSGNVRRLVNDFSLQLKIELARSSEVE